MIWAMGSDSKLVYSTDPKLNKKCVKCKNLVSECECTVAPNPKGYRFFAIIRLEKSGRGGKQVTVIDGFPKNELFLKEITKKLKKKCGSGGTYLIDGREGVIEIQGDKRLQVREILSKEGIKTKG